MAATEASASSATIIPSRSSAREKSAAMEVVEDLTYGSVSHATTGISLLKHPLTVSRLQGSWASISNTPSTPSRSGCSPSLITFLPATPDPSTVSDNPSKPTACAGYTVGSAHPSSVPLARRAASSSSSAWGARPYMLPGIVRETEFSLCRHCGSRAPLRAPSPPSSSRPSSSSNARSRYQRA